MLFNYRTILYRLKKKLFIAFKYISYHAYSYFFGIFCKKSVVVISFYVDYKPGKFYEESANRLEKKLRKWGFTTDFVNINNQGGYRSNTLFKPEFIYKKLIEHRKSIIWIDCDTNPQTPFVFYKISRFKCISLVSNSGDIQSSMGWILKLNYDNSSFKLVREWWLHCTYARDNGIPELDHDALKHAILPKIQNDIDISYLKINSRDVGFVSSSTNDLQTELLHKESQSINNLRERIDNEIALSTYYINSITSIEKLIKAIEKFELKEKIILKLTNIDLKENTSFLYLQMLNGDI